jgi:ubiquinone/menaquinone biosynthesis C-methylase UbiE
MTLCTVDDINAALKEIKRVLKQDGRFYFLEHVAASNKKHRLLQDVLNPLNKAAFCGCNLNRETEKEIMKAGFKFEKIDRFQLTAQGWPDFMAYMIQGITIPQPSM